MKARVWVYQSAAPRRGLRHQGAWHFVSLPKKEALDIRKRFGAHARGWGSLPATATIGKTNWKTSIFPDKKSGTYLLPLKANVREKEDIGDGDIIAVTLKIER